MPHFDGKLQFALFSFDPGVIPEPLRTGKPRFAVFDFLACVPSDLTLKNLFVQSLEANYVQLRSGQGPVLVGSRDSVGSENSPDDCRQRHRLAGSLGACFYAL